MEAGTVVLVVLVVLASSGTPNICDWPDDMDVALNPGTREGGEWVSE